MDILGEFKVDDTSDVKEIKVIPVQVLRTSNAQGLRTVKPIVPHTYIYKLKIHQPKPVIIQYQYVSSDFIIDFDDS